MARLQAVFGPEAAKISKMPHNCRLFCCGWCF
jgi:hypothetical protein